MEQDKLSHKPIKQLIHQTDIKHIIVGIPFNTNYIPNINTLKNKLRDKDKKLENTALPFQRLYKQLPFFSKNLPIYNQQRKYFKPLGGPVHNFNINQVHYFKTYQNAQKILMFDREFKLIHKNFRITV